MYGTITILFRIVEPCTQIKIGVADKLAVPVLLGTSFNDESLKAFRPVERKIVPCHFRLVLILMVHKAESEAERSTSDIRQTNDQDLVLLAKPTSGEPRYIKVTRQVVLKEIYESAI